MGAIAAVGLLLTASARADEDAPASPTIINNAPAPATTPAPAPSTVVVQPAAQQAAPSPMVFNNGDTRQSEVGYHPHTGLIVGGLSLFGVAYGAAAIAAAVSSDVCPTNGRYCTQSAWQMYIPFVGPFLQMGSVSGDGRNTARALLAIDGVMQVGGLAMSIAGFALSTAPNRARVATRPVILPYASASSAGVAAIGRF